MEKNQQELSLKIRAFSIAASLAYFTISLALIAISLTLMGFALSASWKVIVSSGDAVSSVLDAVALIIISIAVFDVGKYLMEEEVLRDRELRSPVEARKTLTKFMVIVVIAVSLEAIVNIFKAGTKGTEYLIYPAALLASAVLALVGLGLFQKLTAESERREEEAKSTQADEDGDS